MRVPPTVTKETRDLLNDSTFITFSDLFAKNIYLNIYYHSRLSILRYLTRLQPLGRISSPSDDITLFSYLQ
jgi:hypothetical protein